MFQCCLISNYFHKFLKQYYQRTSSAIFDVFAYYTKKLQSVVHQPVNHHCPPMPGSNALVIAVPIRSGIEVSNYGTA